MPERITLWTIEGTREYRLKGINGEPGLVVAECIGDRLIAEATWIKEIPKKEAIHVNGGERKILGITYDLSNVKWVDSSGVCLLIQGYRETEERRISFSLYGLSERLESVLILEKLKSVFPVYDTLEEAIAGYRARKETKKD